MARRDLHGSTVTFLINYNNCKCRAGRTTKLILGFLKDNNRPYDIIVLPRGVEYGQMLTAGDESSGQALNAFNYYKRITGKTTVDVPCVFWNPYYKFEYFGALVGIKTNKGGRGGTPVLDKLATPYYTYLPASRWKRRIGIIQGTRVLMPPEITLFHEIGHVKQYYECQLPTGSQPGALVVADWNHFLTYTTELDADNLERHEIPIAVEYHIPPREYYLSSRAHMKRTLPYDYDATPLAFRMAKDTTARKAENDMLLRLANANISNTPDKARLMSWPGKFIPYDELVAAGTANIVNMV